MADGQQLLRTSNFVLRTSALLHNRTWFSFLAGGSSPEALVHAAAERGMETLAITDRHGVYGVVRFQKACREAGIRPIFGAEVTVDGKTLVLLAASEDGYSNLCRLLTCAHLRDRLAPNATFEELSRHSGDLFCLTGTYDSRLWQLVDDRKMAAAEGWIRELAGIFGPYLSIEVAHHLRPGDNQRMKRLAELSERTAIPMAATGDVRYARPEDYRRYDLMTCIRHGITVFDPHPDRPVNAEAYLKTEAMLRRLIPYPDAFRRTREIAAACHVDLTPGYITPPAARIEEGNSPRKKLRKFCEDAFRERYSENRRSKAAAQMHKELGIIEHLKLEEFFLVVKEIVDYARGRGIRCAGRGSAANSIVAYLLGITGVDPIAHNLLFERFLHTGRKGTPDIDVDFDSERRGEVISWMEERFGIEQTAMTGTLVTYQLRSAIRDVAKALGWPNDVLSSVSKAVPPRGAGSVRDYRVQIESILGSSPLLDVMIEMVEGLAGCPRHLGQHSGGMILSRRPLHQFTPVQVSANGVKIAQFDKEDVEALGLVKFDVLGLRMMATLTEAEELVLRHEDRHLDIDNLPLDDTRTFNMIRAGQTLGCFQIESQGQLHLLAKNQPDTFDDLIAEIALFRPGPLMGGMVHPFVRRRRGDEPVTYPHPSLEPVLKDTYGVVLFQEQVLEVAHRFAGMSLAEADDFRSLMSKYRDRNEMEAMRGRFVEGAMRNGVDHETANYVFDLSANFVGYGFCRSHAAAFAKTVYQSAYMKCHHPAAFMAAVMQHRPGMYNQMTLEEDARRFGVKTLPPDIHKSSLRFDLEKDGSGRWAIRKPLTSILEITEEDARRILFERLKAPFESIEDLHARVRLDVTKMRSIARSGALDGIAGDSRGALWEVGVVSRRRPAGKEDEPSLFDMPAVLPADLPELAELSLQDRLSWDYESHGASRIHPMTLYRRSLNEMEIRPIETCYAFGRYFRKKLPDPPIITVAGITMLRQRPPTAKGVLFITLEDETGFIQCVVRPEVLERLDHILRNPGLILRGQLSIAGNWRGLVVTEAWPLNGIFGGYIGHPSHAGGRDSLVTRAKKGNVVDVWK